MKKLLTLAMIAGSIGLTSIAAEATTNASATVEANAIQEMQTMQRMGRRQTVQTRVRPERSRRPHRHRHTPRPRGQTGLSRNLSNHIPTERQSDDARHQPRSYSLKHAIKI
jgi:hypothetical protein